MLIQKWLLWRDGADIVNTKYYKATIPNGLEVYETNNTRNLLSILEFNNNIYHVTVSSDEKIAYLSSSNGLEVVDINNSYNPYIIGSLILGKRLNKVILLENKKLALISDELSIKVINISDSNKLTILKSTSFDLDEIHHLTFSKDKRLVYVAVGDGIMILDDNLSLNRK